MTDHDDHPLPYGEVMYKPSEQGLNLLEVLREGNRRLLPLLHGKYCVSEGYVMRDGSWRHQTSLSQWWPSNLVEALTRAGLIDYNGQITEEGKVAHLPPSSRSFNKVETSDESPGVRVNNVEALRRHHDERAKLCEQIAAYAWYFESARKAGEEPRPFRVWRSVVTDQQIRDMVMLYKLPV